MTKLLYLLTFILIFYSSSLLGSDYRVINAHIDQGESVSANSLYVCSSSKPGGRGKTISCRNHVDLVEVFSVRAHAGFFRDYIPFLTLGFPRDLQVLSSYLLSAGTDSRVMLWDVDSGEVVWRHSFHSDAVWKVDSDGSFVVSSGRDGKVIAVDFDSGKLIWTHSYHKKNSPSEHMVRSVVVRGDKVVSSGFDGCVVVSSVVDGSLLNKFCHDGRIKSADMYNGLIVYSPWGEYRKADIVAVDYDSGQVVWTGKYFEKGKKGYRGLSSGVEELLIKSDVIFFAGDDGMVVSVDLYSGDLIFYHDIHSASVRSVSVFGNTLYSIDRDGVLVFFNLNK